MTNMKSHFDGRETILQPSVANENKQTRLRTVEEQEQHGLHYKVHFENIIKRRDLIIAAPDPFEDPSTRRFYDANVLDVSIFDIWCQSPRNHVCEGRAHEYSLASAQCISVCFQLNCLKENFPSTFPISFPSFAPSWVSRAINDLHRAEMYALRECYTYVVELFLAAQPSSWIGFQMSAGGWTDSSLSQINFVEFVSGDFFFYSLVRHGENSWYSRKLSFAMKQVPTGSMRSTFFGWCWW